MESKLENVIREFLENSNNKISSQEVVTLYNNQPGGDGFIPVPIVNLYLGEKYAKFHEEYTQIAPSINELKPLIKYLDENGFETNLD